MSAKAKVTREGSSSGPTPARRTHQFLAGAGGGPLHGAVCDITSGSPQREGQDPARRKLRSSWNFIWEGSFYHFCHILFIRSGLLGQAHTQGDFSRAGCQEAGVTGPILEAAGHGTSYGLIYLTPRPPRFARNLPKGI